MVFSYYDRYIERAKEFSKLRNKVGPHCGMLNTLNIINKSLFLYLLKQNKLYIYIYIYIYIYKSLSFFKRTIIRNSYSNKSI